VQALTPWRKAVLVSIDRITRSSIATLKEQRYETYLKERAVQEGASDEQLCALE
jgi:hypothetical protein